MNNCIPAGGLSTFSEIPVFIGYLTASAALLHNPLLETFSKMPSSFQIIEFNVPQPSAVVDHEQLASHQTSPKETLKYLLNKFLLDKTYPVILLPSLRYHFEKLVILNPFHVENIRVCITRKLDIYSDI